jgi:hypothetical protein
MKIKIRHRLNMDIIKKYHLEKHPFKQIDKCIEELEEMKAELEKFNDGDFNLEMLLDEMFDSWWMLQQIYDLFVTDENVKETWFMIIEAKIERELKRHNLKGNLLY